MTSQELPLAPREARRDAFERAQQTSDTREAEVLEHLRKHPNGLTRDEIGRDLERPPNFIGPRLTKLRDKGLVVACGRREGIVTPTLKITVWRPT